MKVKVDVSGIQDLDKPVEQDTYALLIKKFELKQPKDKSGYPYMKGMFEITDGPFAGKRLFQNLTTNPEETKNGSSKNYLLYGLLKALGIVSEPPAKGEMLEFDTDDVEGRMINGFVTKRDSDRNEEGENDIIKFSKYTD